MLCYVRCGRVKVIYDLVPSYCVLTMSFEEAVQFALERLHMEDLEEQLRSIKAVRWTERVCLPTNWIWKKSLLPGHSFCDGFQAGQSRDFQNECYTSSVSSRLPDG